MTPLVFLAVALAGGVGAALRYVLDVAVRRRTGERFPWGILVVNLTGALVLGILTPLPADEAWRWILGTGLLGGYTTFSAVAVTTALLAEEGAPARRCRTRCCRSSARSWPRPSGSRWVRCSEPRPVARGMGYLTFDTPLYRAVIPKGPSCRTWPS